MPRLGYRPDPLKRPGETPDLDAQEVLKAAPLPISASLREHVVEVLDQGGLGSCVAHAAAQAVRISHHRQGVANPKLLSRLFGYYCSRAYHHETGQDNGTFIRTFFAALNKFGFCPEEVYPYVDDGAAFKKMPSTTAFHAAFDQKSPTVYRRIYEEGSERVDAVKRALASGFAVCFGTDVSNDFCSSKLDNPEKPPVGKTIAGGHAMTLVGYDRDVFDVVNSWGGGWGESGYWYFDADYIAWSGSRDFWIVEHSPKYSG